MNKIHLIMPMAGAGERFKKNGILLPKPLIEINEKPFFYWAVQSIIKFIPNMAITFVVLEDHIKRFSIDKKIKQYYPGSTIVVIPEVLNGPVLTCLEGIKNIEDDGPIIINDCDHMFLCQKFYDYCLKNDWYLDGLILTFLSTDPRYGFLDIDENGMVIKTVEKEAISNHAICGVYGFKNKKILLNSVEEYFNNCSYKEYYLSGVYNIMTNNKLKVGYFDVDMHVSFGTPEEYEIAKSVDDFEALL